MKNKINAFTLVEMLAIITIMGVLLAVTLPNIIGISEKEATAKYEQTVKNMGLAAETYITTYINSPIFPVTVSYQTLIDNKLLKPNINNPQTGEVFDRETTFVKVATSLNSPVFSIVMTPPEGCFITSGSKITDYNFKTYNYTTWQYDYLVPNCPKEVIIPETIGGTTITEIGVTAFCDGDGLTFVQIPSTVTSIEASAFSNNNLTSINLPSGLTAISAGAFSGNKLSSITIPPSVISIGSSAFQGNMLKSITIPSSVTTIGASAFDNNRLTSIIFQSNSVTSIGSGAFNRNLLPSDQAVIYARTGTGAIDYTKIVSYAGSKTSLIVQSGVTIIDVSAFENTVLTSIVLPQSLTTIGVNSFRNVQITAIVIPNNTTTIGNGAFYGTRIGNPFIPNSVTYISANSFANITGMTGAQIDRASGTVTVESGAFGAYTPTYLR